MSTIRCAFCGHELESSSQKCVNCGAESQPGAQSVATTDGRSILDREAPPVGARVLGQWGDGLWYPGAIVAEKGPSRHVQFDDGDEGWLGAMALTVREDAPDDRGGKLVVGGRVQGQWQDRNWYPGVLTERFGRVWHAKFDDGDKAWLDATRLKPAASGKARVAAIAAVGVLVVTAAAFFILFAQSDEAFESEVTAQPTVAAAPRAELISMQGAPSVGMRVLAPFDSGRFYFIGAVSAVSPEGQVDVSFLDGDRRTIPVNELRQDTIAPGVVVSAYSARDEGWFTALVLSVESTRVRVRFEDATEEWVELARVRIQTQ